MDFPIRDGWRYAAAVDTETTGLDSNARVVQVAALRFRWRRSDPNGLPEFQASTAMRLVSLVRPPHGTWFNPAAVRVTGIDARKVAGAPVFTDLAARFLEVCDGLPIVAHNASFDRRMIDGEFGRLGMRSPEATRWFCSMGLARRTGQITAKLGDLCCRLAIEPDGELHDAGTDALLAARVTAHLFS